MMSDSTNRLIAGAALRRIAERYALAVDTGDGDLFATQFTMEGVLEAPLGRFEGRAALAAIPGLMRARYEETFHAVLSQAADVAKDTASATTYCIARHFWQEIPDEYLCYEMTIRYQDSFQRENANWCLSHRRLEVIATETYPVKKGLQGRPSR